MGEIIQFSECRAFAEEADGNAQSSAEKPMADWGGDEWKILTSAVITYAMERGCDPWDLFAKYMSWKLTAPQDRG